MPAVQRGAAVSQITVSSTAPSAAASNRAALLSGIGVGFVQAATPLVFWWLDSAIVYALGLAAIAAIYIGFAVGDRGRDRGRLALPLARSRRGARGALRISARPSSPAQIGDCPGPGGRNMPGSIRRQCVWVT
jgi:hypothetical protein